MKSRDHCYIQFKALSRKALSYHKRHLFSNILCLFLCPILIVFISWLVGWIINNGIKNLNDYEQIVYCSDKNFMTSNNWFNTNISSSKVPTVAFKNTLKKAKAVNFFNFINKDLDSSSSDSLFGNSKLTKDMQNPCVRWFGSKYPISSVYEQFPNSNLGFDRDRLIKK